MRRRQSGNVPDVVSGEALVAELSRSIDKVVDDDALRLLAPFALGGDAGVKQDAVSKRLGKSLFYVNSGLAKLGPAGVIRETAGNAISVQPEPMRWIIVKRVFFDGPGALDIEPFLEIVETRQDALRTLIGARSRGAFVPDLERWLEKASIPDLWSLYASLGAGEAQHVLQRHPELIENVAEAALLNAPETAIPMLLDRAAHEHSGGLSERPIGQLKSWANGYHDDTEHLLDRRSTLVRSTLNWWKKTRNGRPAIHMLCLAMTPGVEYHVTDPGIGRTFSSMSRMLNDDEIRSLFSHWPSVLDAIKESARVPWNDLFDLVSTLLEPQSKFFPPVRCDDTTRSMFARVCKHHACRHSRSYTSASWYSASYRRTFRSHSRIESRSGIRGAGSVEVGRRRELGAPRPGAVGRSRRTRRTLEGSAA